MARKPRKPIDRSKPWWRRKVPLGRTVYTLLMGFNAMNGVSYVLRFNHLQAFPVNFIAGWITLTVLIWLAVEVD